MPNLTYSLLNPGDGEFISVAAEGRDIATARFDNPNFERILELARADDLAVFDLIEPAKAAATKFERLSERVTVRNGRIYFDGDEINNALTKQMLRFIEEGVENWKPLVAFFEKVQTNVNEHSREQLYGFIERNEITLTPDGDVVFYKGVKKELGDDGPIYRPTNAGYGIVDGVEYENEFLPQKIGSVVEMPREMVRHDPNSPCHTGLHAAAFGFARGFVSGGVVLEIHVNPRDVVSVPYSANKVRVCRYKVVKEALDAYATAVLAESAPLSEEDAHEAALDAPEGTYGEPVLVDSSSGLEVDLFRTPPSGGEPVGVELTPDDQAALGFSVASYLDSDATPDTPVKYPKPAEFEEMQRRAKRRRRNFAKYAAKHGQWTLVGEYPTNRKHWTVNA